MTCTAVRDCTLTFVCFAEIDQVTQRLDNGEAELSQSTAQTTAGTPCATAFYDVQSCFAETMSPGRPVAEYIGPSFATITWPAPPVQLLGLPTARNITGYSLTAHQSGQAVKTGASLISANLSLPLLSLCLYALRLCTSPFLSTSLLPPSDEELLNDSFFAVEVVGSTALSARLAGLQPNTEYAINVITRLNSGVTPAGPSATFKTKATGWIQRYQLVG